MDINPLCAIVPPFILSVVDKGDGIQHTLLMSKESRKESSDKYRKSAKGRAARVAYAKSAAGRAVIKRLRDKPASKAYMKSYLSEYQKDPENIARKREKRLTWREKARFLLGGMKQTAKRKGFAAPDWTIDEIESVITGGYCNVTGIPFSLVVCQVGVHEKHPFAPSPDRIDNSIGYTKKNVQWVCWTYNQLKGTGTDQQANEILVSWYEFSTGRNYNEN